MRILLIVLAAGLNTLVCAQTGPTPRPTATPRVTATPRETPQPATLRPLGGSFANKPGAGSLTNQIGAGSMGTMQSSPNATNSSVMAPIAGSFSYGSAPASLVPSDDDSPTTRSTSRRTRRSRR